MIRDLDYIDSSPAVVDDDEYVEVIQNMGEIVYEVDNYLKDYRLHMSGEKVLREIAYNRKYKYSTLKYFHDILGIKGNL